MSLLTSVTLTPSPHPASPRAPPDPSIRESLWAPETDDTYESSILAASPQSGGALAPHFPPTPATPSLKQVNVFVRLVITQTNVRTGENRTLPRIFSWGRPNTHACAPDRYSAKWSYVEMVHVVRKPSSSFCEYPPLTHKIAGKTSLLNVFTRGYFTQV